MSKSYFSRRIRITPIAILVVMVVVVTGFSAITSDVNATTVGPAGCDNTHPYNCAMSRGNFDSLASGWCSLAHADKQSECRLTFYNFVYTSPQDVKSHANFSIPNYCTLGYPASDAQKSNIPDFCYVIAKHGTKFYDATVKMVNECGLPDNQDQTCASRVKQQFLYDYNHDWASKPGSPTSVSTGLDKQTDASNTPIIQRVNIYLKWITAGIGILAVLGLVISGIQYTAAGDDPKAVAEAKKRIANVVIGLFIYMFMFAALQWLVPGGIF